MTLSQADGSLVVWEILSVLMPLIFLGLFLGILFFLVKWAVRGGVRSALDDKGTGREDESSAEEVLDRRYASGEITQEEYLTIRDDITRKQNA